jgi:hypothetical protein
VAFVETDPLYEFEREAITLDFERESITLDFEYDKITDGG